MLETWLAQLEAPGFEEGLSAQELMERARARAASSSSCAKGRGVMPTTSWPAGAPRPWKASLPR